MPTSITSLAADEIGELSEHHGGRRLRQQERREHPAVERQAAELADDLRHGGGDDRRFDRDHEIRRHNGGEHERTVSRGRNSSLISWEVARHSKGKPVRSPNRVRVKRAFSPSVSRALHQAGLPRSAWRRPTQKRVASRPFPNPRSCVILFDIKEKFMQTRRLGRTDLTIAPLVLGGNVFGWTADKKTSFEVLDRFARRGPQRHRHRRRLFGLGARQFRRRIRDDHRRVDEGAGKSQSRHHHHQGRLADGQGQGRPQGPLHRGGGRGVAQAPAGRRDRPLSLALAGHGDADRGDARRLSAPDRTGKDPLVRRLEPQRQAARGGARGVQGEGIAALRGSAAGIQSRRPPRIRKRPRRPLPARADRRHHLFQPRQGLPHRASTAPRPTSPRVRAATGSRPISIRVDFASSTRSKRWRPATKQSPRKSRSPGPWRGPASPRRSPAPPRSNRPRASCAQPSLR